MDEVVFEGKTTESARILLDAAQELGLPPGVIRSTTDGFAVPQEVADHIAAPKTPAEDKPKRTRKASAKAPAKAKTV